MAYDFNGTSQYLSATLSQDRPTTICAFATIDALNSYREIAALATASAATVARELRFTNSNTMQMVDFYTADARTPAVSGAVSTGTWYLCAGLWIGLSSRKAFRDTSSASDTSTAASTATPADLGIGALRFNSGVSNYMDGKIAEVAVWSAELNADEIASLAKGFSPRRIRPQSLVFYAPLVRTLQDTRGGITITNNNSATVADHPRVY